MIQQDCNTGDLIAPKPQGYYDPNTNRFMKTTSATAINEVPAVGTLVNASTTDTNNTSLLGSDNNGTGPALFGSSALDSSALQTGTTENFAPNDMFSNNLQPIGIFKTGTRIPTGDASPLDVGAPEFPGSLAGSPETNLLPATLNTAYTSSVLLPSTLSVQDAIAQVVECNSDCWID
jgi:hypothetical protein